MKAILLGLVQCTNREHGSASNGPVHQNACVSGLYWGGWAGLGWAGWGAGCPVYTLWMSHCALQTMPLWAFLRSLF